MLSKNSLVFQKWILEENWLSRFRSSIFLGELSMWEKEGDINISGNNRKRR